MTMLLAGIGTALPVHSMTQDVSAELARGLHSEEIPAGVLRNLYRRTEVQSRHSVLLQASDGELADRQHFFGQPGHTDPTTAARMRVYSEQAVPLALAASRTALADAQIEPREVTHIVSVSCSGFDAPGFDIALIRELELRPTTARTHVGFMGCHGALNGLRVANAFVTADPRAVVLVCALELCTLHFQLQPTADQVVSNALFADGAAAVVCRSAAVSDERPLPPTGRDDWQLVASGSLLIPNTEDVMSWRIGDHGFEMQLDARVPGLIREHLRGWLETWLSEHDCAIGDVAGWAIHPGGPRILTACGAALGLADEHLATSREVLAECGNMSSPTVVFILERLRRQHTPRPCVALGFGPGMVVEAALLR
jgi:predicted naringenin-chalcone synthase